MSSSAAGTQADMTEHFMVYIMVVPCCMLGNQASFGDLLLHRLVEEAYKLLPQFLYQIL